MAVESGGGGECGAMAGGFSVSDHSLPAKGGSAAASGARGGDRCGDGDWEACASSAM
uniref:Uncharacterized protein n=1 Tax=Arundo donax TaxID=35708 RepID=A0A0A9AZK8_ARUDO